MTVDRDLDRQLGAWFDDRATMAAPHGLLERTLERVETTPQRPAWLFSERGPAKVIPWLLPRLSMHARVAVAAAIGLLAIGGTLYVLKPGQPAVSGPAPAPTASAIPSRPAQTPTLRPIATGPVTPARQIHTSTRLADGRVLIAGGYAADDVALASAELYDPRTNAFSPTGSLATARGLHTATLLSDGRVLIAGGGPASWSVGGSYLVSAELYDPKTGTFSPTGSMATAREDHTATLLSDGRVLIAGGNDAGDHTVASAELYDPKTGTFSPTGSMGTPRGFQTATLLADGRVLVTGGDIAAWTDKGPYVASAEIYDPRTAKFTATGSMAVGRAHHAATLLADGRVLITGGAQMASTSLALAEIYDPRTGKFTATGSMADGRIYHTATLLSDGSVLVAGGCPFGVDYANGHFLASAEIYDPKAGTFVAIHPMTVGRTYQTATLLTDGRVLITAGEGSEGAAAPLASAEIYDPGTGTFRPAG